MYFFAIMGKSIILCTEFSRSITVSKVLLLALCLSVVAIDARLAHGVAFSFGRRSILEGGNAAVKLSSEALRDSAPRYSVSGSFASGCPDEEDVVTTTNALRALHQAPPLSWDDNLAVASQDYAEQLAARDCDLTYSGGGENLFGKTTLSKPDATCKEAVSAWAREAELYEFNTDVPYNENSDKEVLDFTQMVWKETTAFGCGSAVFEKDIESMVSGKVRPGGCKVVVCRFSKAGNVPGNKKFKRNVLPRTEQVTTEMTGSRE